MDLLKTVNSMTPVIKEDAAGGAVGAGGVAAFSTPLFSSLVKRSMTTEPTLSPYASKKKKKKKGIGLQEAFDDMNAVPGEMDGTQATAVPNKGGSDVEGTIAKLKDLERKEKDDFRNTTTFGLEDENGGLVRVTVKTEQAPQFEEALQSFLSKDDDDDRPMEIGEILFKLKDQFDIVDVVWPDVEEDEEEDTMVDNHTGDMAGGDLAGGDMEGMPPEGGDLPPLEEPAGGEDQAASMLTQVLDMMKADAEARKADAEARKAEAKAKEADAVIQQITSKVKQEEQFLDMEAYNKAKKEEDRETKRLAQLAKWKHDVARVGGDIGDEEPGFADESLPQSTPAQALAPEEEERAYIRPAPKQVQQPRKATTGARVSPNDVANFILNRVKR